ncbi:MAG: Lrp/AsnC family transcriptional regulator [Puia sp.]|nr:Lrp/AsnC family transcriptional regulator [Puia sp.]
MARPADPRKDQDLLDLLRAQARLPMTEIAKRLGVSRAAAQARMERLERDGVIQGYTIRTDTETEPGGLGAIVMIEIDLRKQAAILGALRHNSNVRACYTVSGHFDLMAQVRALTPGEMDELIDWINGLDGVRRTSSSVLLARKFQR